jgi:predicted anti-sigma-YlaC factor YlaD
MLTCKEITELVTDYLEGRMSFARRVSFHLHLGTCRHCRAYLRQMKMTVRTLGKLADEPIPISLRDELAVRLRHMRPAGQAVAPHRPSIIADLDTWLGGSRGWAVVGGVLFVAALFGTLAGGQAGPLVGSWQRCLLTELGAAALPIGIIGLLSAHAREPLAAGALAALAASGAAVGYLFLIFACPDSRVTSHVLIVHVGGILAGALLGAAASRLPAFG